MSAKLAAGLGAALRLGELAVLEVGVDDTVGEVVEVVVFVVVGEGGMVGGGDVRIVVDRRLEAFLGLCSIRCPRLHSLALSNRLLHYLPFLFFLLS